MKRLYFQDENFKLLLQRTEQGGKEKEDNPQINHIKFLNRKVNLGLYHRRAGTGFIKMMKIYDLALIGQQQQQKSKCIGCLTSPIIL